MLHHQNWDYLLMIVLSIKKTIVTNDDSAALQKDLVTLSDWARIWQMNFNVDKCFLLRFTQSHSPIINAYFLNNQAIQCSNVYNTWGYSLLKLLHGIHISLLLSTKPLEC